MPSRSDEIKLPEVMVFAGPNGSGKSTITRMAKVVGQYINADDIKATTLCMDMEATLKAEELREMMVAKKDFTFETVLSTERKDYVKPWRDDNGIQYVGIEDFLLDESLISR